MRSSFARRASNGGRARKKDLLKGSLGKNGRGPGWGSGCPRNLSGSNGCYTRDLCSRGTHHYHSILSNRNPPTNLHLHITKILSLTRTRNHINLGWRILDLLASLSDSEHRLIHCQHGFDLDFIPLQHIVIHTLAYYPTLTNK